MQQTSASVDPDALRLLVSAADLVIDGAARAAARASTSAFLDE